MPKFITLHPCTSSQIARHGYDEETRTMAVEFYRGGEYHYFDVSKEAYEAFVAADSKGSHHHREIRGKYRYEKV